MKKCPMCGKLFPSEMFYHYKDGSLYPYCKSCWIAYGTRRRQTLDGRYSELKKDAKKNGKKFFLTKEDVRELWQQNCIYCGNAIKLVSLDRIDNNRPYQKDNVVACCKWCNYTKGSGSLSFFYNQCKLVVENMPKEMRSIGDQKDFGNRYKDSFVS